MQVLRRFSRQQLAVGGVMLALLLMAIALGIYQYGMRNAVGTTTIVVRKAPGELPVSDPWAPAWKKASAVRMPLSVVSTPGAAARDVQVRALTDGERLAVRLEWADTSKEVTTLRPQDFGDAAAIQLSDQVSAACMGQIDMPVHIWHWKADWQEGSREMKTQYPNMHVDGFWDENGQPLFVDELFARPARVGGSAVEHLLAGGFGTLTAAGPHPMQGKGSYENGRWAVVFTRPLQGGQGDVTLVPGGALQAAFAVWDGKLMQRDGMKYATGWAVLQMEGK